MERKHFIETFKRGIHSASTDLGEVERKEGHVERRNSQIYRRGERGTTFVEVKRRRCYKRCRSEESTQSP